VHGKSRTNTFANFRKRTFVNNVPLGARSFVLSGENFDVILHDLYERLIVELSLSHPRRELAVPDQVVAAKLQVILLRILDISVTILEGEVSTVRLG
jgi:hypothetical protein